METPFKTLHHICIVVHDIEKSVAFYDSIGIGPWQQYPPLSEYTTTTMPDQAAFEAMKYRFVNLDNVQLQLCQPPELPCPQREFLDSRGEGVFHLGFEFPLAESVPVATGLGLEVLMRGERDDGSGFVYYDTVNEAGYVLMTRQTRI